MTFQKGSIKQAIKKGDIFKLGGHRLMCGDGTNKKDVETLLNGTVADLALTDPPYGISIVDSDGKIGGYGKAYKQIVGDDSTETARKNFEIIREKSKNQIIFGGNYFSEFLPPRACWLVWDKENGGTDFADVELAWTSYKSHAKLYKWLWAGYRRKGDRKSECKSRVHPTQKPVGLLVDFINDFSKENETVLDTFGGSGSVLIACEKTNRSCYMMEIDPDYCKVIIDRFETFSGKKVRRIGNEFV